MDSVASGSSAAMSDWAALPLLVLHRILCKLVADQRCIHTRDELSMLTACKSWARAAPGDRHWIDVLLQSGLDVCMVFFQACRGGRVEAAKMLLKWPGHAPCKDCFNEYALAEAAGSGSLKLVRMLLRWRMGKHKLRADRLDDELAEMGVLAEACRSGNIKLVRMLLQWPRHAPSASDAALVAACGSGNAELVRMLLEWPDGAPRADCFGGEALAEACCSGNAELVRMLLEWPDDAPRANSCKGRVLISACSSGNAELVRMLLEWPQHAPRADVCNGPMKGAALVAACHSGNVDLVRMLLSWPVNAPRVCDCYKDALDVVRHVSDHEVARLLLEWPVHASLRGGYSRCKTKRDTTP